MGLPTGKAKKSGSKGPSPLTFLPKERARKLKKQSIDRIKLKAKWKNQKRKEGETFGRLNLSLGLEPTEAEDDVEMKETAHLSVAEGEHTPDTEPQTDTGILTDAKSTASDTRPKTLHKKSGAEKQRRNEQSSLSAKARGKKRAREGEDVGDEDGDGEREKGDKKPTLRDLEEKAYSRKSLHSYKADPLHRRRDAVIPNSERGSRGGGRGRGRGAYEKRARNETGRGQPNMKYRMEAMLERIKRDYAP